jgi:hypothetical protein
VSLEHAQRIRVALYLQDRAKTGGLGGQVQTADTGEKRYVRHHLARRGSWRAAAGVVNATISAAHASHCWRAASVSGPDPWNTSRNHSVCAARPRSKAARSSSRLIMR